MQIIFSLEKEGDGKDPNWHSIKEYLDLMYRPLLIKFNLAKNTQSDLKEPTCVNLLMGLDRYDHTTFRSRAVLWQTI